MKYIILGDLHFGVKKFSIPFFENQLRFFEEQLFPYMLKNNITHIIQTGDLLDNRTIMDIMFFDVMRKKFFDRLIEYKFTMITYIGNHDMYYKNTRSVNMIKLIKELYPENIMLYEDPSIININNTNVGIVPFLVNDEDIPENIANQCEYLFGHFESRGFEIASGVVDTHSTLSEESFKKYPNLKGVFSGHYHIRNTNGFLKYVGTPYNLTMNDSNNITGFHVLNEDFSIDFFENTNSTRYVKMIYRKNMYIFGNVVSLENFKQFISTNKHLSVKVYIEGSTNDNGFEDYIVVLNENKVEYTLVDNREDAQVISENTNTSMSTDEFISDFIKNNHPEVYDAYIEIINSIRNSI